MGGAMGSPIDDAKQARINEIIQDVTTRFATEFSGAYTQAVIKQAKADLEGGEGGDGYKLMEAPTESEVLMSGTLEKRGDSYKTWKARHFVIYNAADNYKIDYHDGKDTAAKLKGTIFCAGYHANHFNEDDKKEAGHDFGIKLVPYSSRRRTWFIKCADEKEMTEWMPHFRTACYKAKPPRDEDACIADAFDITLRNIRWYYWFWSWDSDAGGEGERLGEFLLNLLDREVIREVFREMPENPAKSMTIDLVNKTIGATVKSACNSCWISASSAVRSLSTTIQSTVKDLIAPLVEQEVALKSAVVDAISGTINPVLADKGSKLFTPVLNMLFKPVTNIFIEATTGFHGMMTKKLADGKFTPDEVKRAHRETNYWHSYLRPSYTTVDKMYHGDLSKAADLLGGVSSSTIYHMVIDSMRMIMHRAITTFEIMSKDVEGDGMAVLEHVMSLLFHDSLLVIKNVITDILFRLMDSTISEMVLKPCKELIAPVQATIDAIPIPGLPILLDLPTMLEEIVLSIEAGAINAVLSGAVDEAKNSLDLAGVELGIKNIAM